MPFLLTFSTISILIFLSILTSCYAEHDFLESLPKRLMRGLATLVDSFLCNLTMNSVIILKQNLAIIRELRCNTSITIERFLPSWQYPLQILKMGVLYEQKTGVFVDSTKTTKYAFG